MNWQQSQHLRDGQSSQCEFCTLQKFPTRCCHGSPLPHRLSAQCLLPVLSQSPASSRHHQCCACNCCAAQCRPNHPAIDNCGSTAESCSRPRKIRLQSPAAQSMLLIFPYPPFASSSAYHGRDGTKANLISAPLVLTIKCGSNAPGSFRNFQRIANGGKLLGACNLPEIALNARDISILTLACRAGNQLNFPFRNLLANVDSIRYSH